MYIVKINKTEGQKMKRFMSTCIDNVLRLPMVYSDCSYNMACYQLESEGIEGVGAVTKKINGLTYDYITAIMKTSMTEQIVYFVYDERRGYLMMDDREIYKDI